MSALLRPLSAPARGRRLAPFAVGMVAGIALIALEGDRSERLLVERLAAVGLAGLLTVAVVFVPWRRLPSQVELVPGFAVLAVVGLLVADSGETSLYKPLVLLPELWFAVYAGRVVLGVAVIASDAILLANVLFSGGRVAAGDVRVSLLWAGVVTAVPLAMHRCVSDLQRRAALADRDYVTDLLSRRAWEERLPDELARAKRDGHALSIALFDLDEFKRYNDRHGHQAGDSLLRQVAIAWGGQLRTTDLLARFGGDEFSSALPGCSAEDALPRAIRLLEATPGEIGASAGIAEWDGAEGPESLIERADAALYEAKRTQGPAVVAAACRPEQHRPRT